MWLTNAHECIFKDGPGGHAEQKRLLATAEYFAERKQARAELWALRDAVPDILLLFEVEARVPVELLEGNEDALWEPLNVF